MDTKQATGTQIQLLNKIAVNTQDRVVISQEELTLSDTAQALSFTGIRSADVVAVEFRVRAAGTPTDATYIATFTMTEGDTPTASHGQYVGNGDLYTVTNNANVINFKIIATEALSHIMHIVYYGTGG